MSLTLRDVADVDVSRLPWRIDLADPDLQQRLVARAINLLPVAPQIVAVARSAISAVTAAVASGGPLAVVGVIGALYTAGMEVAGLMSGDCNITNIKRRAAAGELLLQSFRDTWASRMMVSYPALTDPATTGDDALDQFGPGSCYMFCRPGKKSVVRMLVNFTETTSREWKYGRQQLRGLLGTDTGFNGWGDPDNGKFFDSGDDAAGVGAQVAGLSAWLDQRATGPLVPPPNFLLFLSPGTYPYLGPWGQQYDLGPAWAAYGLMLQTLTPEMLAQSFWQANEAFEYFAISTGLLNRKVARGQVSEPWKYVDTRGIALEEPARSIQLRFYEYRCMVEEARRRPYLLTREQREAGYRPYAALVDGPVPGWNPIDPWGLYGLTKKSGKGPGKLKGK